MQASSLLSRMGARALTRMEKLSREQILVTLREWTHTDCYEGKDRLRGEQARCSSRGHPTWDGKTISAINVTTSGQISYSGSGFKYLPH